VKGAGRPGPLAAERRRRCWARRSATGDSSPWAIWRRCRVGRALMPSFIPNGFVPESRDRTKCFEPYPEQVRHRERDGSRPRSPPAFPDNAPGHKRSTALAALLSIVIAVEGWELACRQEEPCRTRDPHGTSYGRSRTLYIPEVWCTIQSSWIGKRRHPDGPYLGAAAAMLADPGKRQCLGGPRAHRKTSVQSIEWPAMRLAP